MVLLSPLFLVMLLPCKEVQKQEERTQTRQPGKTNAVSMVPDNFTILCMVADNFHTILSQNCRQDFRESNSTALLRTTHEKKFRCMLAISMLLTPGSLGSRQGLFETSNSMGIRWAQGVQGVQGVSKKEKWNKKIIAKILFFFFFQHPPQSP